MHATLERIEPVAHNITTFWFRPDHEPIHVAGQFIDLTIKHDKPDNRGEKRWFTVSASPSESPLVSITTKFSDANGSTFKQALGSLKVGDQVNISMPMGDFVLPRDKSRPLLFVAGGIGITPFRSIIKSLVDSGEQRDIKLVYAARSKDEFAFKELFKAYGLPVTYIVSQPDKSWLGETGTLDANKITQLIPDAKHRLIYMSGPEPMVETLVKDFRSLGFPEHHLVGDYFPNYKAN